MSDLNDLTLLGLGLLLPGLALLGLGLRQQRQRNFGVVALTSAPFKLFIGGGLLVLGLNCLLYSLAAR